MGKLGLIKCEEEDTANENICIKAMVNFMAQNIFHCLNTNTVDQPMLCLLELVFID